MSTNPGPSRGAGSWRARAWVAGLLVILLVIHVALLWWMGADLVSLVWARFEVHGSHSGLLGLLSLLALPVLAVLGVIALLPALMLLRHRTAAWIGRVAFGACALALLSLAWVTGADPLWLPHRFEQAMASVRIARVVETPVLLGGQVAGVDIAMDVDVAQPLDPAYTDAFLRLLNGPRPEARDHPLSFNLPPLGPGGHRIVWPEGLQVFGARPTFGTGVPAGRYRSVARFWWPGLRHDLHESTPCLDDHVTRGNTGFVDARWELRPATGIAPYHGAQRKWMTRRHVRHWPAQALQMRIDPTTWTALRDTLPVERCSARAQRKQAEFARQMEAHNAEARRKRELEAQR